MGIDESMPDRDQSKPAEQQGLFRKFDVRRVDGSHLPGGKHYGCRYFVLDLDHDKHAAAAMAAYARSCAVTHPVLSAELSAQYPSEPVRLTEEQFYEAVVSVYPVHTYWLITCQVIEKAVLRANGLLPEKQQAKSGDCNG